MRIDEEIEFGNYYNALRLFYGEVDIPVSNPNQRMTLHYNTSEMS